MRVTAAVFVVEVAAERVLVHVESGAVVVEDGERRIPLASGERLDLSREPVPRPRPSATSSGGRPEPTPSACRWSCAERSPTAGGGFIDAAASRELRQGAEFLA